METFHESGRYNPPAADGPNETSWNRLRYSGANRSRPDLHSRFGDHVAGAVAGAAGAEDLSCCAPTACDSGLVEKALVDQPGLLFGRDFDVAGGEQEDLFGDPLHATVEGVGEPGGEIDQSL